DLPAAAVPRFRADDVALTLGRVVAAAEATTLVAHYDEDWFANPRASEALRAADARAEGVLAPPREHAPRLVDALVKDWEGALA
ncbi:MAG: hypothetical protein AAF928_22035, partial [Myxococcota bacterium]